MLSDIEYLQINRALFSLVQAFKAKWEENERMRLSAPPLAEQGVLVILGSLAPLNSRQLSRVMNINPATVSQYVQRLVNKGLITKTQDKNDRRNWWLNLTEDGKKIFRETAVLIAAYTHDFLTGLDEADQRTLHRLLLKVSRDHGFNW
ncbi:MAG: MarR family transcriptional regulator [Deltaproteobacteria bacterium]|nr:MarR family transcriptional regulator [Deltaproteobacteria bacterium]